MNIADRIQNLRKLKGISQEVLADKVGVSRQAVSKWESEQSVPDLDKVVIMSEYFGVTTDYILMGIEPAKAGGEKNNALTGNILYIASTAFILIGLLCAFGGWYEEQTAEIIWGSMIIQVVGVAAYFIGKLISRARPSLIISWLNIVIASFMPVSLIVAYAFNSSVSPYPTDFKSGLAFVVVYIAIIVLSFVALKRFGKR